MTGKTSLAASVVVMAAWVSIAHGELRMEMFNAQFMGTESDLDLKYTGILISRSAPSQIPTEAFDAITWHRDSSRSEFIDFLADPPGFPSFWSFRLGMNIENFDRSGNSVYDGVKNLKLRLDGSHDDGPHADDDDPNDLPQRTSAATSRPVGGKPSRKIMRSKEHPLMGGGAHKDKYSVRFDFLVGPMVDEPLNSPFGAGEPNIHLSASHRSPGETARAETGITTEADLFFGFNVNSGDLFMSPDQFNSARRQPEDVPATNHEFPDDPFLGSFMGITPVNYVGLNADGLHEFTGGTLFLAPDVNRGGTYDFNAAFDAMFFDPAADVLFAVLSEVESGDELDGAGFSPFIDQFTEQHLFDPGIEGIQLVVPVDLDELTGNFTTDFFGQSTIRLTGALVPEPPSMLLGDTNADGAVNIDDLNNVRNNFGATGPDDGSLAGDSFPYDGLVNIDDLNAVRNNFGAMAAVPEPGGFALALMFVFVAVIARRSFGGRRRARVRSWLGGEPSTRLVEIA